MMDVPGEAYQSSTVSRRNDLDVVLPVSDISAGTCDSRISHHPDVLSVHGCNKECHEETVITAKSTTPRMWYPHPYNHKISLVNDGQRLKLAFGQSRT